MWCSKENDGPPGRSRYLKQFRSHFTLYSDFKEFKKLSWEYQSIHIAPGWLLMWCSKENDGPPVIAQVSFDLLRPLGQSTSHTTHLLDNPLLGHTFLTLLGDQPCRST